MKAIAFALLCACGGSSAPAPVSNNTPAAAEPAPAPVDPKAVEIAKLHVSKLAFEAYPQWAAANPNTACPASIADLLEYVDAPTPNDAWGTPFQVFCGTTLPPGVKGLGVMSAGPDRTPKTADDLTSWE